MPPGRRFVHFSQNGVPQAVQAIDQRQRDGAGEDPAGSVVEGVPGPRAAGVGEQHRAAGCIIPVAGLYDYGYNPSDGQRS